MKSIARREQQVTLVFGDEEEGNERSRTFLLREQSARKAGLLLAKLDAVVQSCNGSPGGKLLPTDEHEQHLFHVAANSINPVLVSMLSRPRDDLGPFCHEDLADLTESQKQELLAIQCELNGFTEEVMGGVKRLMEQIHAIRLATVMIEHQEALLSLSPSISSTGSAEPATATQTE